MLVKAGLVLLIAWLLGVHGVYDGGTLVDILLLIGLMVLPVGTLKARDASAARRADCPSAT
jgi:hypothetical protein